MKQATCLIISVFLILSSGCRKDKQAINYSQIPLYQLYTVSYDITNGSTYVTAEFRLGDYYGQRIAIKEWNSIVVNDMPPNANNYSGEKIYRWEFSGHEDMYIRFIKNGDTLNNRVSISDVPALGFGANTSTAASHKNELFVDLVATGSPTDYERTSLNVIGISAPNYGNHIVLERTFTSTSMTLSPTDLLAFVPGKLTLLLSRERHLLLDEADSTGGGVKSVTVSTARELVLTED